MLCSDEEPSSFGAIARLHPSFTGIVGRVGHAPPCDAEIGTAAIARSAIVLKSMISRDELKICIYRSLCDIHLFVKS